MLPLFAAALFLARPLHAATASPAVPAMLLGLAVILASAQALGFLATRFGQPAVLGELLAGVILGNLGLVGITFFAQLAANDAISALAELGVLILLFEVGLESSVREMTRVGVQSLLVAVVGVATPFAFGWAASALLMPDHSSYAHAFIGATLTATSIGVTARVLKDLGQAGGAEARVILGAAVLDDVFGLVILAVVAGVIAAANTGTALSLGQFALIGTKVVGFLLGAVALRAWFIRPFSRAANRLTGRGVLLVAALVLCFGMAWMAGAVGLAPIVGAFAAGLIMEAGDFDGVGGADGPSLDHLLHPLSVFLVPVFFVVMGMRVDLAALADRHVLGIAAVLIVAGIAGKLACALVPRPPLNRLAVGIGMIPRGEVGLIFANVGLGLSVAGERLIDQGLYSAIVVMVMVTTMVTPPALAWSFRRRAR